MCVFFFFRHALKQFVASLCALFFFQPCFFFFFFLCIQFFFFLIWTLRKGTHCIVSRKTENEKQESEGPKTTDRRKRKKLFLFTRLRSREAQKTLFRSSCLLRIRHRCLRACLRVCVCALGFIKSPAMKKVCVACFFFFFSTALYLQEIKCTYVCTYMYICLYIYVVFFFFNSVVLACLVFLFCSPCFSFFVFVFPFFFFSMCVGVVYTRSLT